MSRDGQDAKRSRPAPFALGARSAVVAALIAAAAWAWVALDLDLGDAVPSDGGLDLAQRFFARAFSPAWTSEAEFVPANAPPLLEVAIRAAGNTLRLAAAAIGVALVLGAGLGVLASSAFWRRFETSPLGDHVVGRTLATIAWTVARVTIAFLRSIHELLWALLFLTAFGLTEFAAIAALALPYGGTLAKIWSELVDEAPTDAARALEATGATRLQVFWLGLVPRALPDMTGYALYRFECALRSSAVLGFFGFETLGLHLRQSFRSTNYGEVWTLLWVLFALVLVFDTWSGALRRRLVR